MGIPQVEHCCFGFSLGTGSVIASWFEIICTFIVLSISTTLLTFHRKSYSNDQIGYLGTYILVASIHGVFSLILAFGVKMKNVKLLDIWTWFALGGFLFYVLLIPTVSTMFFHNYFATTAIITFCITTTFLVHHGYFIVVVHSYQNDLKWEKLERMT